MTVTNQDYIHEEIKKRLHMGNAYYHWLFKNVTWQCNYNFTFYFTFYHVCFYCQSLHQNYQLSENFFTFLAQLQVATTCHEKQILNLQVSDKLKNQNCME